MEFRILGPLEVHGETGRLELPAGRPRVLLALMLVHANEVLSVDRIVDALWPERPPPTAGKIVQSYVRALRHALGRERISTHDGGYALVVGRDELDAWAVESARRRARGQRPTEAARTLRAAYGAFRGAPLQELGDADYAQGEIARLEELRLACAEDVIDAELAAGRHADVIGILEKLIEASPYRERLREQLLVALYRSGRQADALTAYRDARRAVGELGLEPSRPLRELEQAILRQDPSLDVVPTEDAGIADSGPSARSPEGVFVGRAAQLGALLASLDSAIAGSGRLVLLAGEPGIGKSRLAEELLARAQETTAMTLVGRCWEAGGAPAYWPWTQALRACARDAAARALLREQLGEGAADLAQVLPDLQDDEVSRRRSTAPVDPEVGRFRLFQVVSELLRGLAATTPLVLFLDDLHAADQSSLLLLQFLSRELSSSRMLVLAAYRDVDPVPSDAFNAVLAELLREPVTSQVALSGLGPDEIRSYLDQFASRVPSIELAATLHDRTDGNPLFVSEIVRLLALEEGTSAPRDVQIERVPPTIQAVITRRLGHLPDATKDMLSLASVLGRDFELAVLAGLSGTDEDSVLDALDAATAARIVGEVPGMPNSLRFEHVLMRDTLYQQLTPTRRLRLHRRAVRALNDVYSADPDAHLGELAHHALAGADPVTAFELATRAANRARRLRAYAEAARLYQMALGALAEVDRDDDELRCELLLALGETASAVDWEAAKATFLEAATLARRLERPHQLARAAAGYGGRTPWSRAGRDTVLVPFLEEALAALPDDDVELRARLLARLAGALRDEHSRERRMLLSGQALELSRRTGDGAALAYALDGRSAAIFAPDTIRECLALGSELQRVGVAIGEPERALDGHFNMFMAHVVLGEMKAAEADLAAAAVLSEAVRLPVQEHNLHASRAMLALASGDLGSAAELIEAAYVAGRRAQPDMAEPAHVVQLYSLRDFQGRIDDEVCDAVERLAENYPARPVFGCVGAHLYARLGRVDEARQALERLAADDCARIPFDQEWLYALSLLSETVFMLDHVDAAGPLHALLRPWHELNVADHPEACIGGLSRYLGLLACTLERWDEAERHFADAVARNIRLGALPFAARTQCDHACMLRRRDRDDPRAAELASAAARTLGALGVALRS